MVEEVLEMIHELIANNPYETIALSGLILFSVTAYYNFKVLNNFRENKDYSTAKFFIDRRAPRSFWLLTTSALIFPLGIALGILGTRQSDPILGTLGIMSAIALMIALAYFHVNIYQITKIMEKDNEDN